MPSTTIAPLIVNGPAPLGGGRFVPPSEVLDGATAAVAGGGFPVSGSGAAPGLAAPLRKRPLMKPPVQTASAAAQLELAEARIKANVAALEKSFTKK